MGNEWSVAQLSFIILTELSSALQCVLVAVWRSHYAQPTAGDIAEATMECIEVSAVREEYAEWHRLALVLAHVARRHNARVHSQREGIPCFVENVK